MILDVFELGAFDAAIRGMRGAAKIFDKDRVDAQNRFACVPALHYIAHRQRAFVPGFLEICGRQNLGANLVKNRARFFPFGKQRRGRDGIGLIDVLVLVVLEAALDDSVVDNGLDRLYDLALRSRDFRGESPAEIFVLLMVTTRSGATAKVRQKTRSRAARACDRARRSFERVGIPWRAWN